MGIEGTEVVKKSTNTIILLVYFCGDSFEVENVCI